MTYHRFNSHHNVLSPHKREIIKAYSGEGLRMSKEVNGYWKTAHYQYNEDGKLIRVRSMRKVFGRSKHPCVEKEYDGKGKLIAKRDISPPRR